MLQERVQQEQRQYLQALVAALVTKHGITTPYGRAKEAPCCPLSDTEHDALARAYAAAQPIPSAQLDITIQQLLRQSVDSASRDRYNLFQFFTHAGLGHVSSAACAQRAVDRGINSHKHLALALARQRLSLRELEVSEDEEALINMSLMAERLLIEKYESKPLQLHDTHSQVLNGLPHQEKKAAAARPGNGNTGVIQTQSVTGYAHANAGTTQETVWPEAPGRARTQQAVAHYEAARAQEAEKRRTENAALQPGEKSFQFVRAHGMSLRARGHMAIKTASDRNISYAVGGPVHATEVSLWQVVIAALPVGGELFIGLIGSGGPMKGVDAFADPASFGFYSAKQPLGSLFVRQGLYRYGRKVVGTDQWGSLQQGDCCTMVFEPMLGRLSVIIHRRGRVRGGEVGAIERGGTVGETRTATVTGRLGVEDRTSKGDNIGCCSIDGIDSSKQQVCKYE